MSRNWTDNQKKAIDARGMQVLVSAAAGSGKTAVLTERVKNILCDTVNCCSVSQILVVTFTRAAANEMRERIYKALFEASIDDKGNSDYLRKQMTLLPTADICTIDSFCSKIVRENFHLAGVGADFTMLDDKDNALLMNSSVEQVVGELYEDNNEAFRMLSQMFLNERDDSELENVITSIYDYSRSYPSPFLWLDSIVESFLPEKAPNETLWSSIIYNYIELFSDYYIKRLSKCITFIEEDGKFHPDYLARFTKSLENLKLLLNSAKLKNWDEMVNLINEGIVVKPYARNVNADERVKRLTQDIFEEFEKDVKSLEKRTLPSTEAHKEDCERLYPLIKVLCDSVKRLTAVLDEAKKEKNAYNFDDILHKCIDLLVEYDGESWSKTPLADALSEKYQEILIDEYQDTNQAQNIIFEALSKNKSNLYVVGDVKQSIYRFRLASPELFMNLKRGLGDYEKGIIKPSQITLEKNFRSRQGVTEAVNFVFEKIMSESVGDVDYNHREFLYAGASYAPKSLADTELLFIDDKGNDTENLSPVTEPEAIAEYIKRVVSSGTTVKGEEGERPVSWGDFSILLRSTKTKAPVYAEALKKLNIPVNTSVDGEVHEYKEIQFLLSLIRVINNPLLDIPLIAVLMSPVFGFTPDDLSQIRLAQKKADLYVCIEKCASSSPKVQHFLNKMKLYRNVAAAHSVSDFVRFVVEDTCVSDIYYAAGIGEQRKANINGFIKLADDFTSSGRTGLSDFVRYMDNAEENQGIKSSGFCADENSVSIMSIHKSKGLEFPYVIIADCSKQFNKSDSYGSLIVAKETGIGVKIRDDELFTRYHTVSSAATEKAVLFGEMSEELRVLYVAMTRAKEHLVFSCNVSSENLKKKVRLNNIFSFDSQGKLHPYAVYKAGSMAEWILTCFAKHRDCEIIRDICETQKNDFYNEANFSVDTAYIESIESSIAEAESIEKSASVDEALLDEIKNKLSYSYPYIFSGITAKKTASSMEDNKIKKEYFASKKPEFISSNFTGAQRGTAIHKFLELCNFKNSVENLINEKKNLLEKGLMTEKELASVNENDVKAFFENDVGRRLLSAENIYKEYEFSILKSAGDIYSDLPEYAQDEKIVVQGKLDCAFEEDSGIILIDYKTDKISDEKTFKDIYSRQLEIYAEAVCECTGLPVKEVYIYSFKLQKFIKI